MLKVGYPREMRAADFDDWVTDTSAETGTDTHGVNGDIPARIGGRDRSVPHLHALAAQGAPGRGQRHGVAGGAEEDLCGEKHSRTRVDDEESSMRRYSQGGLLHAEQTPSHYGFSAGVGNEL